LREEESGSSLKKRTKKLLLSWTELVSPTWPSLPKVFWLLFFKKVTACLFDVLRHEGVFCWEGAVFEGGPILAE
jgi:hypothetical protein